MGRATSRCARGRAGRGPGGHASVELARDRSPRHQRGGHAVRGEHDVLGRVRGRSGARGREANRRRRERPKRAVNGSAVRDGCNGNIVPAAAPRRGGRRVRLDRPPVRRGSWVALTSYASRMRQQGLPGAHSTQGAPVTIFGAAPDREPKRRAVRNRGRGGCRRDGSNEPPALPAGGPIPHDDCLGRVG